MGVTCHDNSKGLFLGHSRSISTPFPQMGQGQHTRDYSRCSRTVSSYAGDKSVVTSLTGGGLYFDKVLP